MEGPIEKKCAITRVKDYKRDPTVFGLGTSPRGGRKKIKYQGRGP